jgi:hypothetical protein
VRAANSAIASRTITAAEARVMPFVFILKPLLAELLGVQYGSDYKSYKDIIGQKKHSQVNPWDPKMLLSNAV